VKVILQCLFPLSHLIICCYSIVHTEIRKTYEVDPLICPKCGAKMKIVSSVEACLERNEGIALH